MALPLYLALTAAEFHNCSSLPERMGWMACHYSPYGLGLSNSPRSLPEGSMLILNDRTPPSGHDPELIAAQLAELVSTLKCGSVLLDFERPDFIENEAVVKAVLETLPCPVGVSELYAKELECPVFLPPVPLTVPVGEYLSTWHGREIWLEVTVDNETITVTEQGAALKNRCCFSKNKTVHTDRDLHCHYQIETGDTQITFSLQRNADDMVQLLTDGKVFGVTRAIGLYQELGRLSFP